MDGSVSDEVMPVFDAIIIGAGPAGLAAAHSLTTQAPHSRILLLEAGRLQSRRFCPVDTRRSCKGCGGVCNVISGFGGCMHYGDGVKFSLMPSGRRLMPLFGEENAYHLAHASAEMLMSFASVRPTFKGQHVPDEVRDHFAHCGLTIREFPVAVVPESELELIIDGLYTWLSTRTTLMLETAVIDIDRESSAYKVVAHTRRRGNSTFYGRNVVFATGRRGLVHTEKLLSKLAIPMMSPKASIGVRFEMRSHYLEAAGLAHPDMKVSQRNTSDNKIKTFCFCGGTNGGRIKFTNYQDAFGEPIIVLDGHETCEREPSGRDLAANFGLLCQMQTSTEDKKDWLEDAVLAPYRRISGGRPLAQRLRTFLHRSPETTSWPDLRDSLPFEPSVADLMTGPLHELFTERDHASLVLGFEQLMTPILRVAGSGQEIRDLLDEILVIGLELEFLWNQVSIDECCETPREGIFVTGDAAGLAQGVIQAMMMGLQASSRIADRVA